MLVEPPTAFRQIPRRALVQRRHSRDGLVDARQGLTRTATALTRRPHSEAGDLVKQTLLECFIHRSCIKNASWRKPFNRMRIVITHLASGVPSLRLRVRELDTSDLLSFGQRAWCSLAPPTPTWVTSRVRSPRATTDTR